MIKLNLNARFMYYFWIAVNFAALVYAGYFQLLGLAFLKSDFSSFGEVHGRLFPFDTSIIRYYDLTEFLLFILLPVFIVNYYKRFFQRKRYNYLQNPY